MHNIGYEKCTDTNKRIIEVPSLKLFLCFILFRIKKCNANYFGSINFIRMRSGACRVFPNAVITALLMVSGSLSVHADEKTGCCQ